MDTKIERHPLAPFLPQRARVLMLGSFPPKHDRWSMEFFYPNFQNDMWRIMGLLFFKDKGHFIIAEERRFCYEKVVAFCTEKGIAIFDTATAVKRLKDNASDKFLEVVEPTDINKLLSQLPHCIAIVTTGQKATDVVCETTNCSQPKIGESSNIILGGREILFYRMPSSSRAYPMAIDKKADSYRNMFMALKIL
ncbi:MAG: uracil-DNA glycosylase family protein [Rikenellaceae bacterium]